MHDPTDDPAIVNPLDTTDIGRQMWLNPRPLLVAQPKQIPAHGPIPSKTNQDRMESGLRCGGSRINEFRP
jgi:hypothetical protein